MKFKILIWIFFIALVSFEVFAVGLSPASKEVEYLPGNIAEINYYVINTERIETDVALDISGQLAESITLEKKVIHLTSEDEMIPFKVSFKIPEGLSPGENYAKISVIELSKTPNAGVQALIRISSKISVIVPYPEGYVPPVPETLINEPQLAPEDLISKEDLSILGFNRYFISGKINEFSVEVKNNKDSILGPVSSLISVKGMGDIKSPLYKLEPNQVISMVSFWDLRQAEEGEYPAVISLEYNNFSISKTGKVFVIDEEEYNQIMGNNLTEVPITSVSEIEKYTPYLLIVSGLLVLLLLNFLWYIYFNKTKENQ